MINIIKNSVSFMHYNYGYTNVNFDFLYEYEYEVEAGRKWNHCRHKFYFYCFCECVLLLHLEQKKLKYKMKNLIYFIYLISFNIGWPNIAEFFQMTNIEFIFRDILFSLIKVDNSFFSCTNQSPSSSIVSAISSLSWFIMTP